MAGGDNSFERQMIDFYGIDNIGQVLGNMSDGCPVKERALMQIGFDIVIKHDGISKKQVEAEKAQLQIDLYAQLEKDRQEKHNAA